MRSSHKRASDRLVAKKERGSICERLNTRQSRDESVAMTFQACYKDRTTPLGGLQEATVTCNPTKASEVTIIRTYKQEALHPSFAQGCSIDEKKSFGPSATALPTTWKLKPPRCSGKE